jgi:hypothetical protein
MLTGSQSQLEKPTGTHKVKYHPDDEWDFVVDTIHEPVDLALVLPHYRARNQPVNHRMSMSIGSESGPVKVKVVSTLACSWHPAVFETSASSADIIPGPTSCLKFKQTCPT